MDQNKINLHFLYKITCKADPHGGKATLQIAAKDIDSAIAKAREMHDEFDGPIHWVETVTHIDAIAEDSE